MKKKRWEIRRKRKGEDNDEEKINELNQEYEKQKREKNTNKMEVGDWIK